MQITGSYNNIFKKYFETSKCARTTLSTSIFENFYAHAGHTVLNTSASAVSLTYDGVLGPSGMLQTKCVNLIEIRESASLETFSQKIK